MSIAKTVRDLIDARGLEPAEVAARIAGTRNRATFYRILSGDTPDPRLSTVVELCNVLAITPSELLRLAGLLEDQRRPPTLVQVGLRQAFGELQSLNENDRRLCLAILQSLITMRTEQQGRRAQRPKGAT